MTASNNPDVRIGEEPPLTRERVDQLYRATGNIDDPGALMEGFIAESRAYREGQGGLLDMAYGAHPDERLDIFMPDNPAGAPVHIFIHGGYWYQFGKDEWSFIANALNRAGAMVVIPRYTLCPDATIEQILQQMRAMLRWVWQNIADHNGDPDRIYVSGHSAGGHLATELLLTDWSAHDELPVNVIKGVTAISGLYDLRPLVHSYVQEHISLSADEAAALSPLLHLRATTIPLILTVSQEDPQGFHTQMDEFAVQWAQSGNEVHTMEVAGRNHLTVLHDMANPDGLLAKAIQKQMGLG